ncbi:MULTISPECIES: type II secretion system F family protein [Deefgea]|uniref:Type II secretion system F family protein n=1 Tax=Deefgea chitinilytica TaxID=570276 RepID=A0ABS2CCW6_9NEIS|nr:MULTISPECIES: type II secretion system F family protein [Deefgea]MBM5571882.1 type II secretion system F family protein [Deefgea chitinilytica]MBM9889117.1 type II secretion system F family protein [Deefgea sp. CFH1-16]
MATVKKTASSAVKEFTFHWKGKDRTGKAISGEMRASGEAVVKNTLRRQGVNVVSIKKVRMRGGSKITETDIAMFTRQLATMLKSGVPLLTSFDIVAKGHANPSVTKLLTEIKTDIETGSSLTQAFRKHPLQFDTLYCNLVQAGEQAGILDALLARLATYKEKILAVKKKIKSAMFYPTAIIVAAFIITAVIMIFVIPAFKDLFSSFGADLPAPTLFVMAISDFFVSYWYIIFGGIFGGVWLFMNAWQRSEAMQIFMDRLILKLPVFGQIVKNATIARWTRTLSTMFAAGVPLVESLESVGGAAGNYIYKMATKKIQSEVSTGTSLTVAMQNANVFPNMVMQMTSIGEESGSLDAMLSKVADYYEEEVDNAVEALSSLMEPVIMVVLGTLIGGLVIAMYLPIFKMGAAVGG